MRKPTWFDVIALITLFVLLAACAPQTPTPTAVPATPTQDSGYVFETPEPIEVERADRWNPGSIMLDGHPDEDGKPVFLWEFTERVNPLLVVRQTIDDGEYQDMYLVSQEMATVTFSQYRGRNTRLLYQFYDGMQINEAILTAKAIGQLKLGSPLAFQMTIRPTGGEFDGWWVTPDHFESEGITWTYQGREQPGYVQSVQVQNWQGMSNLNEFWTNNQPGYVKIVCGGAWSDTTLIFIKQENRPAKNPVFCDVVSADGYYYVNSSPDAVLETDGLLLQILWEASLLSIHTEKAVYETTWDNVLGYRHVAHAEEVTGQPFVGATATPIVPWKP